MDTKTGQDQERLDDASSVDLDSFEAVMAQEDTEFRTVKAWGGKMVRIGSLTSLQLITFIENNESTDEKVRQRNSRMLIALSLVDKHGKRLVDTNNKDAVEGAITKLGDKDASTNGALAEKILILNGLNKKDAKEQIKNGSGEAQPGVSPSN